MYGIISLTLEGKNMENLTPKQAKILEFIRNFQAKYGSSPTLREIMERFKFKAIATVQDYLSSLERKGYIRREKDKARSITIIGLKKTLRDIVEVPVLGRVAAGRPILAVENIEGYVAIDKAWVKGNNIFALKVEGDSMIQAGILDKDFVIVKKQPTVENGQIACVLIDNEATVKRFYKKKDHIELRPENPKYQPIIVTKDTAANILILGKVIGVFRKIAS